MNEFVFIFRNSVNEGANPSPEQMQQLLTDRMNWMGSIAAQDRLVDRGNRLSMSEGKTVKPGNVLTDGPYTEVKEFINGYTIVKAAAKGPRQFTYRQFSAKGIRQNSNQHKAGSCVKNSLSAI